MKISMQDIAREAGVARSTVSKVMNGYGSISEPTRKRILETVERLGYRQDPMISTLMARIHGGKGRRADMSPVIAIVDSWVGGWSNRPGYKSFATGADKRASELGFRLEAFSLLDPKHSPEVLRRIWKNRGVQGILFAQAPLEHNRLTIDLDGFAAATIGPSLETPHLHRVSPDHYKAVRLALRKLEERGYERPGLVLNRVQHQRLAELWGSGFLGFNSNRPEEQRVPPFFFAEELRPDLSAWAERFQPDVILTHVWDAERVQNLLHREVPREMGLAVLSAGENGRAEAGVDFRSAQVGAEAINLIVKSLHLNERGAPEHPLTVLVDPVWRDGPTLL